MRKAFCSPLPVLTVVLSTAEVGAQEEPPRQNAIGRSVSGVVKTPNVEPVPPAGIGIDDIIPIMQPDTEYVTGTSQMPVTEPDFTVVSSITDGECAIRFTPPLQILTKGPTWTAWGDPPDTEGGSPRVLFTQGASSLTLDFPDCTFATFGFEAEPSPFDTFVMTARFFSGDVEVGRIEREAAGCRGARLFAASAVDMLFTRVVFSSTVDFAIARLRYALSGDRRLQGQVTNADTGDPVSGASVRVQDTAGGPVCIP